MRIRDRGKIKPVEKRSGRLSRRKKILIISIIALLVLGGGATALIILLNQKPTEVAETPAAPNPPAPKYYSVLTGEEITDESFNSSPTFCMQIPNGLDGPRPQVGLKKAGVVFEAIAEAGITRFAAIFQNPEASALGPIRSLRLYYLDWDVPFNCTIVHAGGSSEAIAEARKYRDLSESTTYEWRIRDGYWAPNNLFTSSDLLTKFNSDNGYEKSEVKGFSHLKPEAAAEIQQKNLAAAEPLSEEEQAKPKEEQRTVTPLVEKVSVNFGRTPAFNTVYAYDRNTNTYLRSYGDGSAHLTYTCDKTDSQITAPKKQCGEPSQVSPSVVAVMMVDQWLDTDGYHLRTQTIGTGVAYVFQNGQAIKGTWTKSSREEQIIFKDADGKEIDLAPGQLWVAAVPNSGGSVQY